MKRLVLLLCLCLLVVPVLGARANFQNYDTSYFKGTADSPSLPSLYTDPTTGETVYGYNVRNDMTPTSNISFAYLAFDVTGGTNGWNFITSDSSGHVISDLSGYMTGKTGRIEMKIIGGTPTLFQDGTQFATAPIISINPSYFQILNYKNYDNIVYGESDHHIVGALPTNWTIQRDLINPSATGVYAWSGTAWVAKNSYFFYLDADKEGLTPENVVIKDFATGTAVNTTPVTAVRNQIQYNVANFLNTPTSLGTTLPDGMYTVSFDTAPAIYDTFWVISSGASLAWGQSVYSQGSTAPITYSIAGGGYWDTSTYSYSMVTKSIYGTVMNTQTISAQTGTISVPVTTAYTPGVYYAEIVATKISDGTTNVMNIAYMSVTTYIPMTGFVMNEETGATISAANLNVTQGLQYQSVTSGYNGNWSSNNGWVSGSAITINTTASGFKQNIHTFTPLTSSAVALNISMAPTTSAYSGVSIGGVVTDSQYGNPIVGATYHVQNSTEYMATTNIAGFARVDGLVNGNLYSVWSSKTGYGNSSVTQIVAVGT